MVVTRENKIVLSFLLSVFLSNSCDAIKCFDCNSANNSACLDMHLHKMHAIVPVVDCAKALPNALSSQFFCRKMVQTILHPDQTPDLRVIRSCGWVKHKRECYTADNKDHLETVCQCFGDMCNAGNVLENVKITVLCALSAIFVYVNNWRSNI
ncbi:PREDICTED: uncharacterized protein LOC106126643 [Papilio xuthus]|uniref:Uncharacterized protein LOC106126643 n=1 Tax=Papilio xuthus TaxID=66420 RepID=A0AAJ6ZV78_PAPXU|nr:PREDICTED: uncharacterized protein LOC106126643 [Papilio xuthus]